MTSTASADAGVRLGRARTRTIMTRLDELAAMSSDRGGITRLFLTREHKQAAVAVESWMRQAGMAAQIDAVGNVVGRYEAAQADARTLILGSHIDTVRNAGRFDGCLGVVTSIEAVGALHEAGLRLPYAVEVIAFGDEEGVRFPEALAGSSAVAGRFDPVVLEAADDKGVTLREALRQFGCDPSAIGDLAHRREDVLGYLELHIEQGPVLEAEDLPVGVVTAIAGASRFRVKLSGTAGHAGTVPMNHRRDAFAALAEMAVAVEILADQTAGLVATIGKVEVLPGAVNVIPGQASFTVDTRSPDDAVRRAAVERMQTRFAEIAARRDVAFTIEPFYAEAAAPCAAIFRAGLARSVERQDLRVLELPSGAGHDGLAMIGLCPIGMLFVRCAGGISHNPAEAVSEADVGVALDVLLDFLRSFTPREP